MQHFTPVSSLVGGLLIGLGSAVFLLGVKRIAGVSSIVGGLFTPKGAPPTLGNEPFRAAFLVGLLIAGAVAMRLSPEHMSVAGALSTPWLVVSGLLVGYGTRLGSGCTSGHGVCGISRFSKRSLVAVATFMFTAGVVVYVLRHLLGLQGTP
jgi:uncharacterized protein